MPLERQTCVACGTPIPERDVPCPRCGTSSGMATDGPDSATTTGGLGPAVPRAEFQGTARFRLERKLGSGGMGVVFAAFDRQRARAHRAQDAVQPEPRRGLAPEARVPLAGRRHAPEPGRSLRARRRARRRGSTRWSSSKASTCCAPCGAASSTPPAARTCSASSPRACSRSTSAGKLHRDLKPSNVLVTAATSRRASSTSGSSPSCRRTVGTSEGEGLVGTLAYMSPEQVERTRGRRASDWYAVGVMLYQALTGRLPYTGDPTASSRDKRDQDPEPPRARSRRACRRDLVELCAALLARDPASAPERRRHVCARLGRRAAAGVGARRVGRARDGSRSAANAQVACAARSACGDVGRDQAVVVCVHGSSGIGKSALTQWFLRNRVPGRRRRAARAAATSASRCRTRRSTASSTSSAGTCARCRPTELPAFAAAHVAALGTPVPGAATGRRSTPPAPRRCAASAIRSRSGARRSMRCASCLRRLAATRPVVHRRSTICSGATPTARCASRSCCDSRDNLARLSSPASAPKTSPKSRSCNRSSSGPGAATPHSTCARSSSGRSATRRPRGLAVSLHGGSRRSTSTTSSARRAASRFCGAAVPLRLDDAGRGAGGVAVDDMLARAAAHLPDGCRDFARSSDGGRAADRHDGRPRSGGRRRQRTPAGGRAAGAPSAAPRRLGGARWSRITIASAKRWCGKLSPGGSPRST